MHPSLRHRDHRPWPIPDKPWIGRQTWRDLLFAHWPLPARALRPFVPPSVTIDEHEGTSWVGVVPFRMTGVMARGIPDLPGISAFPELNLRLYVVVGEKPGVWFVSLDATNPLAIWAARRFFHLPYFRATMSTRDDGARIHYRCQRRTTAETEQSPVIFNGAFWPVAAPERTRPGSLEAFLTERYCLYAQHPDGHLLRTEVHHPPWALQAARADIGENTVAPAQGIPLEGAPALLHFSRRIDVIVWTPQAIA